ncbi:hypothetical protein BX600DRAFT_479579 [Xylariales sp. PMI_506]|nr:hypothetical protein BX600DRAFT_479579 [Xylariales sp. PMI_506]
MAPLRILIIGGGISGPATAFWLAKQGHTVTVVERHPELREQGLQVDVRGQAVEVLRLVGLLDVVRELTVKEEGVSMSFTSEFEIMRGDLVRLLYEVTKNHVSYRFGTSVGSIEDLGAEVLVSLSDGTTETFDLVVGADGSSSRARQSILGPDFDAFKPLGVWIAYCKIPTSDTDTPRFTSCHFPGKRFVAIRAGKGDQTQANFGYLGDSEKLASAMRNSLPEQNAAWRELFPEDTWVLPRIFEGISATQDFYYDRLGQVKAPVWSKGRIVLVGDAAYCPSPLTGMGTSLALIGAYVLAGEIAQHSCDIPTALSAYDETLRPTVEKIQQLPPGLPRLGYYETLWGIRIFYTVAWIMSSLRVDKLISRLMPEDVGGWKVPKYNMHACGQ